MKDVGSDASAPTEERAARDRNSVEMPRRLPFADRLRARIHEVDAPTVVVLLVTLLGLTLRVEHALTFDGPTRGSDYDVYVRGVRWVLEHKQPFDFDRTVPYQVRYQPPLWYALGALVLRLTGSERAIAGLGVVGWLVRQLVLARILREAIPRQRWSAVAALSLHAVLPISVLIDGKVNPEGLHATLFALGVYALWRLERQALGPNGMSTRTAAVFGAVAGVALLTKATAIVLVLAAAFVLAARVAPTLNDAGGAAVRRRLLRPAMAAVIAWCVVTEWWCIPNILKRGHPFPHDWDTQKEELKLKHPILDEPVLHRRPLAWFSPFPSRRYFTFPIIRSPDDPPPNFWGVAVAGTWSDFYNRGFCRLRDERTTDRVWGGAAGFARRGRGTPDWSVTIRCLRLFSLLTRIGALLSISAIAGVFYAAWTHLCTRFREGSLVLPVTAIIGVLFVLLFALTYPLDEFAVLNPRYLLPVATPMCACLGLALARIETARCGAVQLVRIAVLGAIGVVAALVVVERFGR